jgi:flagellar motor component MotA|tara:strand:+ start:422 stop:619 length:198 start_codon:yes stop_codon:yes gene_type:complete
VVVGEMLHQELVQQMEEAVIQVEEVHLLIQAHLEQQEQVLPTLVVVAVVVRVHKIVVTVDQVLLQ